MNSLQCTPGRGRKAHFKSHFRFLKKQNFSRFILFSWSSHTSTQNSLPTTPFLNCVWHLEIINNYLYTKQPFPRADVTCLTFAKTSPLLLWRSGSWLFVVQLSLVDSSWVPTVVTVYPERQWGHWDKIDGDCSMLEWSQAGKSWHWDSISM